MNRNDIVDSLGRIDEEMIHDVEELRGTGEQEASLELQKTHGSLRGLALAACLILVFVSGFGLLRNGLGGMGSGGGGSNGGSCSGEGEPYMLYTGPVFPLALCEETTDISAARSIDFDFSQYSDYMTKDHVILDSDCRVKDEYVLENISDENRELALYYPFAESLSESGKLTPTVTVNDKEVEAEVVAGNVYSEDDDLIDSFYSWQSYRDVADSGYNAKTADDRPGLNEKVIVYELYDMYAEEPGEDSAPTAALEFSLDYHKTGVLSYGFNGTWETILSGGIKAMKTDAFIPQEGDINYGRSAYLIVLGEDIKDYEVKTYTDDGLTEELEGAGAKVRRYEITLSEALGLMASLYTDGTNEISLPSAISRDDFAKLTYDYIRESYEYKSENAYSTGNLEDAFDCTLSFRRILYQRIAVTVPAGGSIEVKFDMIKEPSRDFRGENLAQNGYDMLTWAGSRLDFSSQTASISGADYIGIVDQNFGFELEQGVTEVRLDPAEEHYYMDIAWLGENGEFFVIEGHRGNWFVGLICLGLFFVGLTGLGILLVSKLIDHFANRLNKK